MDRPVSLMRSELLIALMPDCRGRRESERGGKKEKKNGGGGGGGSRSGDGEREGESAEGMRPRGARLGLGQGFRNAPLEIPVKAGAGLEECSSRELREREEAGWGRAGGMFPQSTPLTLEQQQRGSAGGERPPPPLLLPHPSGSRMAADQVSVRGSASCRQGFGRPWGAGRGEERGGGGAAKALLFLSKKHFTTALSHRRVTAADDEETASPP